MDILKRIKSKLVRVSFAEKCRQYGALIGKDVVFFAPETITFDFGRAYLIQIGDCCKFTSGNVILAHDYSKSVTRIAYGDNVGGLAPVRIGNNCFFGINAIVLMGTSIGDNCIIGAGSVVKGVFPSNCVIAGNPAKVICSLEEYYERRKAKAISEAVACVKHIYNTTGRMPTIKQMGNGHAWLYLPRTKQAVEQYSYFFELSGDNRSDVIQSFLESSPAFSSFEAFLTYCEENALFKDEQLQ